MTTDSATPADRSASGERSGGAFGALRTYRDFRLLWLSTLFTGTAQFMQQVAMGWIALELTDSPLFVGAVAFAAGIAFILVAVPAGSLIDHDEVPFGEERTKTRPDFCGGERDHVTAEIFVNRFVGNIVFKAFQPSPVDTGRSGSKKRAGPG